jgi:hypothetical protein
VSQDALDYVEGSAAVKALPGAEKLVLRQLALLHKLEVNCAFVGMETLARMSLIGGKDPVRQCRRIVERLEKKGFVVRHQSLAAGGMGVGRQMSNEYELPGMKVSTAVGEQLRQQVFKVPRQRVAAQLSLLTVDGALSITNEANGAKGLAVVDTQETVGGESSAVVELELRGTDVEKPVEENGKCPGGVGRLGVRGEEDALVSALDVNLDVISEVITPLPPLKPVVAADMCKSNDADQGRKAKATASARATATTSSLEAGEVSTESGGEARLSSGPGFRVGSRVVPFGGKRYEDLDGLDLALREETVEVLRLCGVPPETSRRRQRMAVEAAIRLEVLRSGDAVAEVGALAVRQWRDYLRTSRMGLLFKVVELRKFFAEGMWLDVGSWNYDSRVVKEQQRYRNAGIGAYRSN